MLHYRDGIGQAMSSAWFPPDMILAIQAKEFSLCFIRLEHFDSHYLRVFRVPFGKKIQAGRHVPFTLVEYCSDGYSSRRFSSLHRETLDLCLSVMAEAVNTHVNVIFFHFLRNTSVLPLWNLFS